MAAFRMVVMCIVLAYFMDQVFASELIGCTAEYQKVGDHTLCKADSPDVTQSGVSAEDKKLIVDTHNDLRSTVEPTAMDMTKMTWDDRLAAVAQKSANQCIMEHDTYDQRQIPEYGIPIGQNLAAGYVNWYSAIMAWYNEIDHFTYGKPSTGVTGHFAQMMFGHVDRVGCGFAICEKAGKNRMYYACNYAPGISGSDAGIRPYKNGSRCAACPNSCKNGLCDCQGILCRNGGDLDMDTCKCKCPSIYIGDSCETLNCPETDGEFCGNQYPPSFCTIYERNFMNEQCPYMCKACKYPNGCQWKWCQNNGKLNADTCTCECTKLYSGDNCETALPCPDKDENQYCGNQFPHEYCEGIYAAFMKKTCPVLCGHCGA